MIPWVEVGMVIPWVKVGMMIPWFLRYAKCLGRPGLVGQL